MMKNSHTASCFTYIPRRTFFHRLGEGSGISAEVALWMKMIVVASAVVAVNIITPPLSWIGIAAAAFTSLALLLLLWLALGHTRTRAILRFVFSILRAWMFVLIIIALVALALQTLVRRPFASVGAISMVIIYGIFYPCRLWVSLGLLALLLGTTRLSRVAGSRVIPERVAEFLAIFLAGVPIAIDRLQLGYTSLQLRGVELSIWGYPAHVLRRVLRQQQGVTTGSPQQHVLVFLIDLLASTWHDIVLHVGTAITVSMKVRKKVKATH